MELKLINGDYVPYAAGGFETVMYANERLQRVLYKLSCRKGGFAPFPDLGSELYKLLREKKDNRNIMARKYILEALTGEEDIALSSVSVNETENGLMINAEFDYTGGREMLMIGVSE